ncbi:MAG: transcriptional regulator [Mycolicibacterium neoaurum]|uniref:transcriptional regulator n=1 Tax=Mycolicibacterium neoaurum TaxID=1795 RepID=UPI002FFB2023
MSARNGTVIRSSRWKSRTPEDSADVHDDFAERLNRLFEVVHPPWRGPYTSREMLQELSLRGHVLSAPYLSQLRLGRRTKPSRATINVIAQFFGVRADYFLVRGGGYQRRVDEDLYWLGVARDPLVRHIVSGLLDLPAESRDALLAQVEACSVIVPGEGAADRAEAG